MKNLELRSNLFSFDPTQLDLAYRVQIGPGYINAWSVLQNEGNKQHQGLPTNALEEMLAVLSGGPVKVDSPLKHNGLLAILILNPLSVETINDALALWSLEVLRRWDAPSEGIKENLRVVDIVPLPAHDLVMPGNVSPLAYSTIPWRVARAMSQLPMETRKPAKPGYPENASRPIKLYQSSNNALVAWDHPVVAKNDFKSASALHVIEPSLALLRGCDEPFIRLHVKLSQVMPNWRGKKKSAWVKSGDLIVHALVATKKEPDGWRNDYAFPTNQLLAYLGHSPLPELSEGEIPVDSAFRPIHSVPPANPLIASGPGPVFLDQASFHLRAAVKSCQPLTARKVVSTLKKAQANPITSSVTVRIGVIASQSQTMLRLEQARKTLLTMPFFKVIAPPNLELSRINAEQADRMLTGDTDQSELNHWLLTSVIPALKLSGLNVAIVETCLEAAAKDGERDPKHFIRRVMAENGIATQFIMQLPMPGDSKPASRNTEEKRDFKALNSVTEAIRLNGYFPALFARTRATPAGTTIYSVWLDQVVEKGGSRYLPVITRALAGSAEAEIFWFDPKRGNKGRWFSFTEGVAAVHATKALHTQDAVKSLIAESLLAPTVKAEGPLIACVDYKLRQLYPGLQDSRRTGLPPFPVHAAIVRIREQDHVAQMTGVESTHPDAPHYIAQKLGLFQSTRSPAVFYFVSPSKVYGSTSSQRYSTRYDADPIGLKEPWQQLGITEITLIEHGSFESSIGVAEQIAQFCRNAPLWDGHIRLPSPMHLGAQIAGDHPILEMRRKSDANRMAES